MKDKKFEEIWWEMEELEPLTPAADLCYHESIDNQQHGTPLSCESQGD